MKPSASLKFPFRQDNENDCLKRAHTVEETIISAIRLYLITKPGSRVGNMVGSFVPELLYQLLPSAALPNLADQLKGDLIAQFPGVDFIEVTLTRNINDGGLVDLVIKITFTVLTSDSISDLTITLPSIFSAENLNNINKGDI